MVGRLVFLGLLLIVRRLESVEYSLNSLEARVIGLVREKNYYYDKCDEAPLAVISTKGPSAHIRPLIDTLSGLLVLQVSQKEIECYGTYCLLIDSVVTAPIVQGGASLVISFNDWNPMSDSAFDHALALAQWLRPGGNLIFMDTKVGCFVDWSLLLGQAGLAIDDEGVEDIDSCDPHRKIFVSVRDSVGIPEKSCRLNLKGTNDICDVLRPLDSCQVAVYDHTVAQINYDNDASIYDPSRYNPRLIAVRLQTNNIWWSSQLDHVQKSFLDIHAIPKYFSTYSPYISRLVPDHAKRILDIGCGAGMLLAELRENRNNTLERIDGIEPHPMAAALARKHLDSVYNGIAEQVASQLPNAYYDAIILSDILEHAIYPDLLLRLIKPKLAPQGRLCISIPNMRFFSEFLKPLLDGSWDYAPHGVLDRTHLRWFTYTSFLRMAESAGFIPDGPALRVHFGEDHKISISLAQELVSLIGHQAASQLHEESDVRQFLIPLKRRSDALVPFVQEPQQGDEKKEEQSSSSGSSSSKEEEESAL